MKRILTLMVMTLLVAAVPQTTFSKVKKTKKTTKTTKTTNSTSKKSSGSTTSTTTKSTTTNTSFNTQTYPVPKSYVSYSNNAPKIETRKIDEEGFSSAYTSTMIDDVIYSGRDIFFLEVETKEGMAWTIDFGVFSFNKELVGLANYLRDNDIESQKEKIEIIFSDGTTLSGEVIVYCVDGNRNMSRKMAGTAFFDKHDFDERQVLSFVSSSNTLGNSFSTASNYVDHQQYVSNLFMNYNITTIRIGNNITIPIDQSKWGTKHTMTALFKALADDSGNYEAFGLTAPTSNSSSYSSSSTSTSTLTYSSSSSSSTSTYSTPSTSTYSTPSYNYSYKPEPKKRFWGFSAGYVQKQWQSKEGGSKEKMGFWEDSKVVHGVQAGFRATPYFKFGLGLNTGLLYEYYYTKSQPMVVDGYDVYGEMQEHALYMPVHLTYRLKFNDFHIYAFGGVGLDYGIMSKVQLKENGSDYVGYDNSPLYETEDAPDWKRFNASYEFGGGLRYKMVELQFTMSRGFLNMSHDSSYKLYQNKPMMFSLGFMF